MAPKPPANIRLVHSRPEQLGDRPRLILPDYMRHLKVVKVDTTMSDADAKRLAAHYDTRGPLPKKLSRDARMRAYEARYIASGGREGEKWKHRANMAETSRNIGLAGATAGAALTLAGRNEAGPAPEEGQDHPPPGRQRRVGRGGVRRRLRALR